MCGRYTQTATVKQLRERFSLTGSEATELAPRLNIAPTQEAPIVIEEGGRALKLFRWGLVPAWSKDKAAGYKMINARAETLLEKPSYAEPFRKRRCLVVADSFYEWKKEAGGKVPMRITLASREPFAMAGLWEAGTFTIITTGPNETMRPIHDRMPVILRREDEALWLDAKAPLERLSSLLRPSEQELTPVAVPSPSGV